MDNLFSCSLTRLPPPPPATKLARRMQRLTGTVVADAEECSDKESSLQNTLSLFPSLTPLSSAFQSSDFFFPTHSIRTEREERNEPKDCSDRETSLLQSFFKSNDTVFFFLLLLSFCTSFTFSSQLAINLLLLPTFFITFFSLSRC